MQGLAVLFSLLKIVFPILDPLNFHINLESSSVSSGQLVVILIGIAINPCIKLRLMEIIKI